MACEICGRGSCTRSFHSLAAQEEFDNRPSYEALESENVALREQLAAAKADAERYEWLCADLETEQRARRSHLFNRISVMGKGAVNSFIDTHRKESSGG